MRECREFLNRLKRRKKMKGFIKLFVIGVSVFLVSVALFPFSATTAVAQEKAEDTAQEKEVSQEKKLRKEYELESITVTAQKREENVQDVPMSISVFSDIEIEDADIRDTFDLIHFSPNLHMSQNRQGSPGNIIWKKQRIRCYQHYHQKTGQ
jgi:hypothetical protein